MTVTNPSLIELQREVKKATQNVTAAKKAVAVAKNAIGAYFKQRLNICVDKGLLVHTVEGYESTKGSRFWLRVDNNKVFVHYKSDYAFIYEVEPIDKYMSWLEDSIRDYKELYVETGEEYYQDDVNEKTAVYDILKSVADVLYN